MLDPLTMLTMHVPERLLCRNIFAFEAKAAGGVEMLGAIDAQRTTTSLELEMHVSFLQARKEIQKKQYMHSTMHSHYEAILLAVHMISTTCMYIHTMYIYINVYCV